ncbi:X-Pro dipeptidyl-peptidase-domain-containing protein [Schizothecium vesticola]|uniref:X-Pro dipeptidyl-peptidase-domain-containing protein n=1 Tax=Schizothecium vesticola TaxID=314040 RepID=A0AA40K8M7_9PEZI|nr:X-Pro dipeptidyl-peptidase-domain-containing protein [Schizothecium vesticola]
MSTPPTKRGLLATRFHQFVGKKAGLPPEKSQCTVSEVRIPVTDGDETFELVGDLYQPVFADRSEKSCGTILVHSPYGRGVEMAVQYAYVYAARGYHVLFVSCRGTFGSGGIWQPFRTEAHDGQVIVRWMRKQTWYTGSFATIGGSFLAYTQLALLSDPPEDMVAAVMEVSPHDVADFAWGTGAMQKDLVVWSEGVKNQHQPSAFDVLGPLHRMWGLLGAHGRLQPVFDSVPFLDAVKKHFGPRAPWVEDWITHNDPSDPYYEPMRHSRALDEAKIPILLTAGWHDVFGAQTLEQYRRLRAHNDNVRLVVGPWSHMQVEGTIIDTFSWVETHLAKRPIITPQQKQWETAAARIFITGLNEWRLLPLWPPADTKPTPFFLHPDHTLSPTPASPASQAAAPTPAFTFSPASPTPTIGGAFLGIGAGIRDDSALATRTDVLSFTAAPFASPLPISGTPCVILSHETDSPHADVFVRISEVDAKGRSRNVTEGFTRLDPKRGWKQGEAREVVMVLRACAHVFRVGTRMRVYVAGGSSRVWLRNTGTEGGVEARELKAVRHWVHVGAGEGTGKGDGGEGGSRVVVGVGEFGG